MKEGVHLLYEIDTLISSAIRIALTYLMSIIVLVMTSFPTFNR